MAIGDLKLQINFMAIYLINKKENLDFDLYDRPEKQELGASVLYRASL